VCEPGARNGAAFVGCSTKTSFEVGTFQPNPFGLYDMHGNVYEWVQDCKRDTQEGQPPNGAAYEVEDCASRVVRGGAWFNSAFDIMSVVRDGGDPVDRVNFFGFRVARTIP
jgi:formylglycine-generating enzyme required for sulfatase activity